jgi:DNA-binding GntR family transcriptional regulator
MRTTIDILVPKYYVIKNHIKELILSKKLLPNQSLPSEKDLMDEFSVSRITVRKALDELSYEGYIYKIQGRGSFVKLSKQGKLKVLALKYLLLSAGMYK